MSRRITWAMLMVLVLGSGTASAQSILVLDEDVLTGEIEKPEAFYVLRASSLSYDNLEPEASFLEELYQTVEEPPF